MELCIAQALSNLPQHHHHRRFCSKPFLLHSETSLPLIKSTISLRNPGSNYLIALPRARNSEELIDRVDPVGEKNVVSEEKSEELEKEETPPMSELWQEVFEFFYSANVKLPINYLHLDTVNAYPILFYGSGTLVALWLASAILGAIDSIPVFPEVMELVGFAFTIWFSSRYLLLKKNRDELSSKIEELKQKIIGIRDD